MGIYEGRVLKESPEEKEPALGHLPYRGYSHQVTMALIRSDLFVPLTSSPPTKEEPKVHSEWKMKSGRTKFPSQGNCEDTEYAMPLPHCWSVMATGRSWRDQSFHIYHTGLVNTVSENKTF